MKTTQNEKGYILIFTLITIFIILMFLSTLTLKALNQNKQVEQTDTTYEVTAIAEMGVEYYHTKVLDAIKDASEEVNVIISNNTLTEDGKSSQINDVYKDLRTTVTSSSLYNPIELEYNTKSFYLNSISLTDPESGNPTLEITVIGKINEKTKSITAKFDFPSNLATKVIAGGGNSLVTGGNSLFKVPNFSENVTDPFPPPGVAKCPADQQEWMKSTCYTNYIQTLNKFQDTTVYFTGTNIDDTVDNENFHNSFLYVKGDFNIRNFNNSKDVNFYINGKGTFGTISTNGGVLIQALSDSSFQNIKVKKDLKIYLNGYGTFSTIDNENNTDGLKLYAKGASFQSINDLKESLFEIDGETKFNQASSFINTDVHSTGNVNASQLRLSDSKFYFDSKVDQKQLFSLKSSSKVCIRGDYHLENLNIDSTSHVYILNTSTGTLSYQNSQKEVEFLNLNQFNTECKLPISSDSSELTLIEPKINLIKDIIYN